MLYPARGPWQGVKLRITAVVVDDHKSIKNTVYTISDQQASPQTPAELLGLNTHHHTHTHKGTAATHTAQIFNASSNYLKQTV